MFVQTTLKDVAIITTALIILKFRKKIAFISWRYSVKHLASFCAWFVQTFSCQQAIRQLIEGVAVDTAPMLRGI